ncbi:MAG TPA: CoA-binding protein, partial [Herpetosiphonaceae bacterium]|nr:CoA-binding protein [Herpetosiphonaceae bacterium]
MSQGRMPGADPAHDILRTERPSLDAIFAPKTVAVIGADKAAHSGRPIIRNLRNPAFGGRVVAVGPDTPALAGIDIYPTIADVPGPVDLAVVVSPAPDVPDVIGACVDAGVRSAIITSAGFREVGAAGLAREQQIRDHLRRGRIRLIGPNGLGVMRPATGLNATYAKALARPGSVGFVSQSGALCTAILDWSLQEHVGFSAFVSAGVMLDVGWGDLIDFLGSDPQTQSILIYMESIGDARAFLSAAREVARTKPIIVLKAGRTGPAALAASSHTGGMAGSDAVLDAAFRRSGVLRVNTIAELFDMAGVLAKQPRPGGRRLTILTNAGGPGVLATDALTSEGGELAALSPTTIAALDAILPEHWSQTNPIDIGDDADPECYARAVEIAAADPGADGLLVILTPQATADPSRTAELLRP